GLIDVAVSAGRKAFVAHDRPDSGREVRTSMLPLWPKRKGTMTRREEESGQAGVISRDKQRRGPIVGADSSAKTMCRRQIFIRCAALFADESAPTGYAYVCAGYRFASLHQRIH